MNLSLDTSFGFGDIPNNQSIFMNDNDITVDDYLMKMSEKCKWTKKIQDDFRVIHNAIKTGIKQNIGSEVQDDDLSTWEPLAKHKPPTIKGSLVNGYNDFWAPAVSVYRKGDKVRKIYTYDNDIVDIKQSILSVAKEIFMQQEAYRLLHSIEIKRNTRRQYNILSYRSASKTSNTRRQYNTLSNRSAYKTRNKQITYSTLRNHNTRRTPNKRVSHKSLGKLTTLSMSNPRRIYRSRTEMEQLEPFFIIPKLTHKTFNMRTVLEMDYLEAVEPDVIEAMMIENDDIEAMMIKYDDFAITWRDRIYRLFAELKRNGFYHNDTSIKRKNVFFIKLNGVDDKKKEDQYKVGIIDFGQSEISFREFRGQPQLDGLPMDYKENTREFIEWIKGKRRRNIENIYGGSRKENNK
jgi:hypothetical protein